MGYIHLTISVKAGWEPVKNLLDLEKIKKDQHIAGTRPGKPYIAVAMAWNSQRDTASSGVILGGPLLWPIRGRLSRSGSKEVKGAEKEQGGVRKESEEVRKQPGGQK